MATFDELQSVLNNPFTNPDNLSLADAFAQVNQPVVPPTLPEIKTQAIGGKLQEKQARLGLKTAQDNIWAESTDGNTNLIDLMQASGYKAAENISNMFTGEVGNNAEIAARADEKAGVSLAYRQNLSKDYDQVLQDVANDDYLGALGSAANVAFRGAADSAVTALEYGAGALATSTGLGAVAGIKKVKDAVKAVGNIKDRYDVIKEATLMKKMGDQVLKVAKTTGKELSKTSILTADMMQQQIQTYTETYGEAPSQERIAGMLLMTSATMVFQGKIIEKLFLPKFSKTVKGKDFKEKFKNEIGQLVAYADRGVLKNVGLRIAGGVKKVAAAGGGEAVQEYAQTWAEILGQGMQPDEATSLLQSALQEFKKTENINEAITGAFIGGAAGGATKLAMSAPGAGVGATFDVASGITNAVTRNIADKAQKTSQALLSDQQRADIAAEFETRAEELKQFEEKVATQSEEISKAKTFTDITDPEIKSKMLAVVGDGNIADSAVFEKVKESVRLGIRDDVAQAHVSLIADRALQYGKQTGSNVVEGVTKVAKGVADFVGITEEDFDKAVVATKMFGSAVVKELKEFNKSATYGLSVRAIQYGGKQTRQGFKDMSAAASEHTPAAINKLADILQEDMPKAAAKLREIAQAKTKAEKVAGLKKDTLVNSETLSPSITNASKFKKATGEVIGLGSLLWNVHKGNIEDLQTAITVRKALRAYTNSDAYKKQEPGALTKSQVKQMETKLNKQSKELRNTTTQKVKRAVKTAVKAFDSLAIAGIDKVSELTSSMAKNLDNAIDDLGKESTPSKTPVKVDNKLYTNATESAVAFIAHVKGVVSKLGTLDREEASNQAKVITAAFSSPEWLKQVAEAFGTTDPADVYAIAADLYPPLIATGKAKDFRKLVESVFPVDSKSAKTSPDEDTKNSKENTEETTDTVSDSDTVEKRKDGVEVEPDDDNRPYIAKDPSEVDFEEWIDSVFGRENVCEA